MWKRRAAFLTAALLVGSGGCPQSGGNGQDTIGAADLTGTWRGQVECVRIESLNGQAGSPITTTVDFEITFDADGFPQEVVILGYSNTPDNEVALKRSGDEETVQSRAGTLAVTQQLSVTAADYTRSGVRLEIRIVHTGAGGNLTVEGTGTQTIDIALNADGRLEYEARVEYQVEQRVGEVRFDTGSEETCTGTLTKQ